MLHIFTGSDFATISKNKTTLLDSLQTKRPDAQLITLESDTSGVVGILEEQCSSVGLFDAKSIINGSGICENPEAKAYLLKHAQTVHESDNAFVLYEPTLSTKEVATFSKAGVVIHQHEASQSTSRNMFYLADLLLAKNKSALWQAYQDEIRAGVSAEELFGLLTFQSRALHLSCTRSQAESGLKPFVYNKAQKSSWTKDQAQQLHYRLVSIYHQSRRGGMDLTTRLEQLILKLPK